MSERRKRGKRTGYLSIESLQNTDDFVLLENVIHENLHRVDNPYNVSSRITYTVVGQDIVVDYILDTQEVLEQLVTQYRQSAERMNTIASDDPINMILGIPDVIAFQNISPTRMADGRLFFQFSVPIEEEKITVDIYCGYTRIKKEDIHF